MAFGLLYTVALEILFRQLHFLASAVYALPILIGCAIVFYGKISHQIKMDDIKKLVSICLFCSLFGLISAFAEPIILYINLCIQGLTPRIPCIFEEGMLPYTTSFICHAIGIMSLIIFNLKLTSLPVHRAIFSPAHYLLLILASVIFFISIMLKYWSFSGYPDGISPRYLLALILQLSLHRFVESFVPAGICAIAASWCNWSQNSSEEKKIDLNLCKNSQIEIWSYLCCIIGLIPRCLVALSHTTRSVLQELILPQAILPFMETCCALGSLLCFVVLLISRIEKRRILLWLAFSSCLIVWNWSIIHDVYQHLMTR